MLPGLKPHDGQPVLTAGVPLASAGAVCVLLHGRGATAEDMLSLVPEIGVDGVAWLAPQAAGRTWYPNRFLAPVASNQPFLDSALTRVRNLLGDISAAVPPERTVLGGFSQGACLAATLATHWPRRWGGLALWSGARIGPLPGVDPAGSLGGTPTYLGCSEDDPHIPLPHVQATAATLQSLGARLTPRVYPGSGHEVTEEEIRWLRERLTSLVNSASTA